MDIERRIKKIKINLLMLHPFWGSLALYMIPKADENLVEPTTNTPVYAATDGKYFIYNPKELSTLTDSQITFVFLHELFHNAMQHIARKGGRDHLTWNVACDYFINLRLKIDGFDIVPGVLLDDKYKDMSSEKIYSMLPKLRMISNQIYANIGSGTDENGSSKGTSNEEFKKNSSKLGSVIDTHMSPKTKEEARNMEKEWKAQVAKAAVIAKSRGKLPASVADLIEEVLDPKLSWKDLLRRFIVSNLNNDYTWLRANKRFQDLGFTLPSLLSDGLGTIIVAVDTSGSVSAQELEQFFGEMQSILDLFDINLRVLQCDATVQKEDVYTKGDKLRNVEIKGRGGTSFIPIFEYIEEKNYRPQCLIYMTDMEGYFPKDPPEYPTLWVASTKLIAPFGETIEIDVNA